MDESAIRGFNLLNLNDSGAASRTNSIPYAAISVEGYDTSLKEYFLKIALTKHFSSCVNVTHVCVPRDYKKGILKSVAFMRITGEDCLDKALQLSGTDVGGWVVIVKAAPMQIYQDPNRPKLDECPRRHRLFVSGYDTSLPEIDLQMALCNHFSSCGEVVQVDVFKRNAYVSLEGERCVEKANELSGCNIGGMKVVVGPDTFSRLPTPRVTGYMPLSVLIRQAKEKKQEMEREMDMVMDEKKKQKMKMEVMKIDRKIRRHTKKMKKQYTDWERRMEMENIEKSREDEPLC